jgi:hypothetical protein
MYNEKVPPYYTTLFSITQKALFSACMSLSTFAPSARCYIDIKENDARCTREVKSRTAMATAAFNKKSTVMTNTLDSN